MKRHKPHYDMPLLDAWIAARCEVRRDLWEGIAELHADYYAWSRATGYWAHGKTGLSRLLDRRGFEYHRITGGKRGFIGLRLRETGKPAEPIDGL